MEGSSKRRWERCCSDWSIKSLLLRRWESQHRSDEKYSSKLCLLQSKSIVGSANKHIIFFFFFNSLVPCHSRYYQGMSDLLAPILCEIQNESEAFWCFVGLMQRGMFVCTPTDNDIDKNLVSYFILVQIKFQKLYIYMFIIYTETKWNQTRCTKVLFILRRSHKFSWCSFCSNLRMFSCRISNASCFACFSSCLIGVNKLRIPSGVFAPFWTFSGNLTSSSSLKVELWWDLYIFI